MRSRLQAFHPETEFKSLLDQVQDLFQRGPNLERRLLMTLNANVQKLVDDVARNSDVSKSILAAQDVLSKQITDLQTQLGAIQPGQAIDDEDLAAINASVAALEATNTALGTAIPASTSAGPAVAPSNPTAPLTNTTQPVTSDSAGNPIAPDAPGQPGQPAPGVTPAPTASGS